LCWARSPEHAERRAYYTPATDSVSVEARPITMRAECRFGCGTTEGVVREVNGQDVVRCARRGKAQYNAPRVETGRAVRTLATRPTITPSQRSRVFEAHDHRCIVCGKGASDGVRLDLAHLISREDAAAHGFLDELIDSEWNLAPMCAECNSGQGRRTFPIALVYRTLLIKATPRLIADTETEAG
jgi:hypothetical protein